MGRIQSRVSAVLTVYDSYQNKRIEGKRISVTTKQGVEAIHKEDGCFVFLEKAGVEYLDIEIKGAYYQTQELGIELSGLKIRTVSVRMEPARQYPFYMCTTYLRGTVKDGTEPVFVLEWEERTISLTADYQSGDTKLMVSGLLGEVPGRQFRISDMENGNAEFLTLQGEEEKLRYGFTLASALQHSYKKGKCRLQSVYPVTRAKDGTFFTALQTVPKEGCEAVFYADGRPIHRIRLRYGTDNICSLTAH